MIAIIPAAGKGTRMAQVAAGSSKEMLVVGGKPVIQWAIDEAREAGAKVVKVVSAPEKQDLNAFLAGQELQVVMQSQATGLGPAVGLGAESDSALIILPDTLYYPNSPSFRVARALEEGFELVIPVETVPDEAVHLYGIVEPGPIGQIKGILEKPKPVETTSRLAIAGRFGLGAKIMGRLGDDMARLEVTTRTGEVGLTTYLNSHMASGSNIVLPLAEGEVRYDCGSPEGYRAACEAIG